MNLPEEFTKIKLGDIRGRLELVSQSDIDKASALMDAKGIDLAIREGLDIDLMNGI